MLRQAFVRGLVSAATTLHVGLPCSSQRGLVSAATGVCSVRSCTSRFNLRRVAVAFSFPLAKRPEATNA